VGILVSQVLLIAGEDSNGKMKIRCLILAFHGGFYKENQLLILITHHDKNFFIE